MTRSRNPELVVLSGMSGAGRTTAMKALEDLDFFCVDNLPVVLLDRFVDLFGEGTDRLAVTVDVRERDFLEDFPAVHTRLRERGVLRDLIFIDASDDVLLKRFNETRRAHPTRGSGSLLEDIAQERDQLAAMAARADQIIDTTHMSVHELKRTITRIFSGAARTGHLEVELVSFGFRYGAAGTADLLIDVRFLPNPNFEPELCAFTGLDPRVSSYVLDDPRTAAFLKRFFGFLDYMIPLYEEEGKAYLTIAIGCTGGRHRSVAVIQALDRHLRERNIGVRVSHRDITRGEAKS
ncbi:MAG: RNase adapter RapZ [bacterium]|nr:RNase adapter RapZ [bacterium]